MRWTVRAIIGRHPPRKRGIQYTATSRSIVNVSGIPDRPPEPVIGRALRATRWRAMTVEGVARSPTAVIARSPCDEAIQLALREASKEAELPRRVAPRNDVDGYEFSEKKNILHEGLDSPNHIDPVRQIRFYVQVPLDWTEFSFANGTHAI